MKYNPQKIEHKWQKFWEENQSYRTKDAVKDQDNFMLLTEFPYPSGHLHIGHWYAFAVPDILARYLKMNGKNVFYPIGFDAFGLPAENAAIQRGIHPEEWTKQNISYMTKQFKSMGTNFDWSRVISTIDPEYYKWTQWIFLQFYKRGLAYRAKTKVNWCPNDKTVLANEQVINGCCERCGSNVLQKEIEQWMFKTTAYAQRLLDDLENLEWPETIKTAQENWIGRSQGAVIRFLITLTNADLTRTSTDKQRNIGSRLPAFVEVFTTRPDTIFGATYLILAPEHEIISKLEPKISNLGDIKAYVEEAKHKTELERLSEGKEKTGVEIRGIKAINPANNQEIPIWIADYVLSSYGTGAIMAVPAHDQKDFQFAQKFNLPIEKVIVPPTLDIMFRTPDNVAAGAKQIIRIESECYEGKGELIDSGRFTGMLSQDAKWKITEAVGGKKQVKYRLHDWVISRQRYWGVPIPMIHCKQCGYQPVPEKQLPITLPPLDDFKPADDGRSPLARATKWLKTKCPKCGQEAERETDTMDTFVDSSWYFIRYTDPKNKKAFASKEKISQWLPVPLCVGGAEHNTMHLLYSRFFTKALFDLGLINFKEPFIARQNHGIILGPDNQKMSKSKSNVTDPDVEVKKYGADAVRMHLAFMGPYDQGGPWNPRGINGVYRFLQRFYLFFQNVDAKKDNNPSLEKILNKAVKKIGDDIRSLKFNTGVSELMKLLNGFEKLKDSIGKEQIKKFPLLLAPFAPHLSEEIYSQFFAGKGAYESIHQQKWPEYNPKLEDETISLIIQINGKTRQILCLPPGLNEEAIKQLVLDDRKIKNLLADKTIRKTVFVPDKLLNLVY